MNLLIFNFEHIAQFLSMLRETDITSVSGASATHWSSAQHYQSKTASDSSDALAQRAARYIEQLKHTTD
jgi:hypothetical protein